MKITRRTLLGGPLVAAGALLMARRFSAESQWLGLGSDSRYLIAQESPSYDQSFAAFALQLSVVPGDELVVHVRAEARVDVEIRRVGWSASSGFGRVVAAYDNVRVGPVDANAPPLAWPVAGKRIVTGDWASGLYVAVVVDRTDPSRRRFAPFVVRAPGRPARIVVSVPFTTYHAYNAWGGASLYRYNSPSGVAQVLPIARPFDVFDGAGFMFYGEWQLARWLDREQYDVSYITSYDLHRDTGVLDGAAVFVTAFHDEYWSTPMRNTLERFIATGGNAMFLAANSIYWRVRLDETSMICHKATSAVDDPDPDVTATWRSPLIRRPEKLILGSQYGSYEFPYGKGFDWTVAADDHWLYEGTDLRNGATLNGLVGYEWDYASDPIPANTTVLASTEFVKSDGDPGRHDATERIHPGGGTVVNVGTTYWPRFLLGDQAFRTDRAVQQMTHNMLRRLG